MKAFQCAVLAAVLGISTSVALAQRANHKISGDAFRGHRARTYERHARDSAQTLYYAGCLPQPVEPQVARTEVASIRTNIVAANKVLDQIQEANATKPEVGKAIEKIKERHVKVAAKCDELEKHIARADKDSSAMCDCCVDIIEELDAADTETSKLLKDLKADEVPKPQKFPEKDSAPAKK